MGIKQKLERLEKEIAPKHEPRLWYITNVPPDEDGPSQGKDPWNVEIFPGLWAFAAGGAPFTTEEIRKLKEEHKAEYEQLRVQGKIHEQA